MRIISGRFRGLSLSTPKDARVRPTSDRVREALFNVLAHKGFGIDFGLEGARVLDLFAGTGALGLEALSRGAQYVMLVDDHAESRGLIRENVEAAQATGVTRIWRRDASALGEMPPNAGGPFDLVFLDPPYRQGLVGLALGSALAGGWIAPKAVIVAETSAGEDVAVPDGLHLADTRSYGDTIITILVRGGPDPA